MTSGKTHGSCDVHHYELPVFEHGGNQREQIEFLVDCDYDFFTDIHKLKEDDNHQATPKLSLNGVLLKKREKKYDEKISASIDQMRRSYRHLNFFNKLSIDVKAQVQNVIIEQNKWLRLMQEE